MPEVRCEEVSGDPFPRNCNGCTKRPDGDVGGAVARKGCQAIAVRNGAARDF
jgi:hypothetical protein